MVVIWRQQPSFDPLKIGSALEDYRFTRAALLAAGFDPLKIGSALEGVAVRRLVGLARFDPLKIGSALEAKVTMAIASPFRVLTP